ncbi:MAG: Mobile element protein [Nitrospira sp.]|jgi:hypothetical protein|nr:MAG: Mobile element protein [Nitrospira sp.]
MPPQTVVEAAFEQDRKPTSRKRFLDEMNRVVPWAEVASTYSRLTALMATRS